MTKRCKVNFGDVDLDDLDPRTQRQIKRKIQKSLRKDKRESERNTLKGINDSNIAKHDYQTQNRIRKLRAPKNPKQESYRIALFDPSISIITATGIWGSGKTSLATEAALHQLYDNDNPIEKIVIARPTVSGENEIGFEPGDKDEKLAGWCKPVIEEMGQIISPQRVQKLIEEGIIELLNIDQVKGRNFHNTFLILDEAEDISFTTLKNIIARHGYNSKTVISGDAKQNDRTDHDPNVFFKSGQQQFYNKHPLTVVAEILNDPSMNACSFVFDDWDTECIRSPESKAWGKKLESLGLL